MISMRNPTISAVLPLYNHERYISGALHSIFEQLSPVDEIILVDDGSGDNGFALAEKLLADDRRSRLFRQQNRGAHEALNRGIASAEGEFIAVLNTDDLFLPNKIGRCRKLLNEHPDAEMICGGIGMIDAEGDGISSGPVFDWLNRATSFKHKCRTLEQGLINNNYVISTSNMVFSRELWKSCGGFQKLRYCHDLDFILSALRDHRVIIDEEEKHILYRIHERNTISEDTDTLRLEVAAVLADAIFTNGKKIVDCADYPLDLLLFSEILKEKNNAGLLCALLLERGKYDKRSDFYALLDDPILCGALLRQFPF